MPYFPGPDSQDARAMLAELGLDDVQPLFESVPEALRNRAKIDLDTGVDEPELIRQFRQLAQTNRTVLNASSFVGAGAYPYPPVAAALYALSRGEFLTAYTPYQPEISQGTLTAIFEFQTWVSELSGLPLANASLYDGATALAEAILMGLRVRRKAESVFLADSLAPDVRDVVHRYLRGQKTTIHQLPTATNGRIDTSDLDTDPDAAPRIVVVGYPNGYGVIEDLQAIRTALRDDDLLITHTPDPHAWLLLESPGALGADVAVGEGQPFGVPLSYGGPYLGLFATREKFLRQTPGRLCGKTVDAEGRPGYVLTLSTREQHIRREKATSNICSNQGVIALLATVTMGVLGPDGLRRRALASAENARRLLDVLQNAGFERRYAGPMFNEFVVDHPQAIEIWETFVEMDLQLGIPMRKLGWDEDQQGLLVAATAAQVPEDFQRLEACLSKIK